MKRELTLFATALMFFTRIPCPFKVEYSTDILNRSSRYYSLVGILVGTIAAIVFWSSSFLFGQEISILLSMVATILITGSFHEDGLADSCDAFGGGYEKERILEIMKDSRIGTFGAVALILILSLKFFSLMALADLIPILIVGHSLSRAYGAGFILTMNYVTSQKSKSKPLASKMRFSDFILNFMFAYAILIYFYHQYYWMILLLSGILVVCSLLIGLYIKKRIGGYTGDVLGAIQQILEVVFYLFMGGTLWPYIL